MKIIKCYEEFSEEERNFLINNKLTYVDKSLIFSNKETNSILQKIKEYDISNFTFDIKTYEMIIIPDDNFRKILSELNSNGFNINNDMTFDFSINENKLNIIDLFFDLPLILRGLNFGYKIYKFIINKFEYITSDYGTTNEARNIWYKLMIDSDYYCFTSKICSGVICKNLSDDRIKNILAEIKNKINFVYKEQYDNLIFDEKIKEKMKLWKL